MHKNIKTKKFRVKVLVLNILFKIKALKKVKYYLFTSGAYKANITITSFMILNKLQVFKLALPQNLCYGHE